MRTTFRILCIALLTALFLPPGTASARDDKEPTAIIVDNATGEPIEGVIALANWTKHSITKRAWPYWPSPYTNRARNHFHSPITNSGQIS